MKYLNTLAVAILFTVIGGGLYAAGLHAPWYFDDLPNIVENSRIRSVDLALFDIFSSRGVALLSFQLNYALSGLSPLSYRLVNIALHVVNALLVWRILVRFYRETPLPALVGGLFFLVHPVQTQAVTYIVQRQSCLATFFVLLTVCTYLRMHEAPERVPRQAWYVMSLLCAALAIWTKQNTVVIPLLLLLVDRLLQPGTAFRLRPALLRLMPFMLLAVAAVVQQFAVSPAIIAELSEKERLLSAAMTGAGGEAD
jgi:hypothetical protein